MTSSTLYFMINRLQQEHMLTFKTSNVTPTMYINEITTNIHSQEHKITTVTDILPLEIPISDAQRLQNRYSLVELISVYFSVCPSLAQ